MRLRSQRDTVPLSFEEMLTDFDPHTLDEPFDWVVKVRLSLNLQPSLCLLNEFGFYTGWLLRLGQRPMSRVASRHRVVAKRDRL